MCTVDEVRRVVKQELRNEAPSKIPAVMLNLGVYGMIAILGWLLYDAHLTHNEDAEKAKIVAEKVYEREKDLIEKTAARERVTLLAIAGLTRKVVVLTTNLENLKQATIAGTSDRWYRKDAISTIKLETLRFESQKALIEEQFKATHIRHDLSQERQDNTDVRLGKIEKTMKEYHDGK